MQFRRRKIQKYMHIGTPHEMVETLETHETAEIRAS